MSDTNEGHELSGRPARLPPRSAGDFRSPEEASAYLNTLKAILQNMKG